MSSFTNDDLVLKVRTDYAPSLIRLDRYEAFLDALCGEREYQKEAIRSTCTLLAGGEYESTRDLAQENYLVNSALHERYGSLDGLTRALPFPDKLACSIDLATGTGKSWVMYGVARILLAEGTVDRVLVLCPSLTIEAGLTDKFKRLSSDATLLDLMPTAAACRTPQITDANVTTGPGDICIENIAATYAHVRSSVRDSFVGRGASTLVLNDEAHHIYSPPAGDRAVKRWREFLQAEEFQFRRIVGLSGTCYIGDDYFPDVTARYSLRRAIDEEQVKHVLYVSKDESLGQDERFQKYLALHRENQARYGHLKPLSIVVTARIAGAEDLAREFASFLSRELRLPIEDAERQVLVVSSKEEHRPNVARLRNVDRPDDPIEWIFSVSMLTEGWDVENVFQIIPHEKRAFASKLLIAQVLGRGLRIPPSTPKPTVRVFNHSAWSSEIGNLVAEVLEQERRLHSYPATSGRHASCHFNLHQLAYDTLTKEQELTPRNGNGQVNLFTRGYVHFESQPIELQRATVFIDAVTHREETHRTTVHYPGYTVAEVVQRLRARLKSLDSEGGTNYAGEYPVPKLRSIVAESLRRIGEQRDLVSEGNLQQLFRAMGNTRRESARTVRIELKPAELEVISTQSMSRRSIGLGSLGRDAAVFYDNESFDTSDEADQLLLTEIDDADSSLPKRATRKVDNVFHFRSPVNLVLASHEPERAFITRLFEPRVSERIRGWVKAPDTGFYEIGYSWRRGDHTKQAKFNPDLFLQLAEGRDVLVIELKDDDDLSDETRAKLRFAAEHFERINSAQDVADYHVKFLSPQSYDGFFQALGEGRVVKYVSTLQAALENAGAVGGRRNHAADWRQAMGDEAFVRDQEDFLEAASRADSEVID